MPEVMCGSNALSPDGSQSYGYNVIRGLYANKGKIYSLDKINTVVGGRRKY